MDGPLSFDLSNISLAKNVSGMKQNSQNHVSRPDQRSKEQVVEDLINFTYNADIKYTRDISSSSSHCNRSSNLSTQASIGKPVRLEEQEYNPNVIPQNNSLERIDLNTIVRDYETGPEHFNYGTYEIDPDLRIPDYSLDVINEDSTTFTMKHESCGPLRTQDTHRDYAPLSNENTFATENRGTHCQPKQLKVEGRSSSPGTQLKVKTTASASPRRKFLRRRSSERKPFENVPDFIKEELLTTSGCGHFTMAELMCCLLFAHREALSSTSYANIRAKMGNKRSRVSIRRKIEKIVLSETGLSGGLLGLTGDQNQLVLEAIWSHLMKLLSDAETFGTVALQNFAAQLRDYAQNPLKYALKSQ